MKQKRQKKAKGPKAPQKKPDIDAILRSIDPKKLAESHRRIQADPEFRREVEELFKKVERVTPNDLKFIVGSRAFSKAS